MSDTDPEAGYHYVYSEYGKTLYHTFAGRTYCCDPTATKRLAVREAIDLGLEPCAECYTRQP